MKNFNQITEFSHEIFRLQVKPFGTYLDATMGNGHDTMFLCELAGEQGKVLAFDIQQQAVDATDRLLRKHGVQERARLILDSHVNMCNYVQEESVDGIYFNFGYLPGGDHSCATRADTSVEAVRRSLPLLKKGGMTALCIYSGGDTGFEEKDRLLEFLKEVDEKKYLVIVSSYFNRKKNPPVPAFIIKR